MLPDDSFLSIHLKKNSYVWWTFKALRLNDAGVSLSMYNVNLNRNFLQSIFVDFIEIFNFGDELNSSLQYL